MSARHIVEEYGVPKSTLQDRVSGHLLPGTKSGKKRYLDDDEEKELLDFLMYYACIGFPQARTDAIAFVQDVCDRHGIDCQVTHGCWKRLCQRHPDLTLRAAAICHVQGRRGHHLKPLKLILRN